MVKRFLSVILVASSCAATPPETPAVKQPHDVGFIRAPSGALIHQNAKYLPLLVAIRPNATDWSPIIKAAIHEWNEMLGFPAFFYLGVLKADIPPMDGVIPVGIDAAKQHRADTYFTAELQTGLMHRCYVEMPVGSYSTRAATLMAMHELGHVLGLDHDNDLPRSLMHPEMSSINIAVTDADIARLRLVYASTATSAESATSHATPAIP